ncbi:MAG TPA: rhodanese-like domain-containing protein [Dehalococcoidia bacterium]|nr:rhodanese-like domain-containing protein [Dehalococcoidia bacterium]
MEPVGRRMVEIAEVTVPSVSARETYDRMQSGQTVVVLDIREPDETVKGYIEGALLLPRGRLEGRIEELVPDKNACIIAH